MLDYTVLQENFAMEATFKSELFLQLFEALTGGRWIGLAEPGLGVWRGICGGGGGVCVYVENTSSQDYCKIHYETMSHWDSGNLSWGRRMAWK